jgi:IS5 family transposase
LSDPATEDALIEVATMRRFAGIELISNWIPDETTILSFRHLLDKHELGMTMRQVIIVDATLIAAPSSTKNKSGKRDPEMHQTKKGNQWYHRYAEGFAYGMKVHIGVDKDNSPIHSVETTAGNVHDLTPVAEMLHGKESVVYADTGYQVIERRLEREGTGVRFRVAMRPGKRRALPIPRKGGWMI